MLGQRLRRKESTELETGTESKTWTATHNTERHHGERFQHRDISWKDVVDYGEQYKRVDWRS